MVGIDDQSVPAAREVERTTKAFTAGVVYQPNWADGLRMSVDYYSFDIEDAIIALSGQQIIDGCFIRGQQTLCDSITLNATGGITRVTTSLINVAKANSSGFDTEVAYSLPVGSDTVDEPSSVRMM